MTQRNNIIRLKPEDAELLKACAEIDKICLSSEAWSLESFRSETEKDCGYVFAAVQEENRVVGFLTAFSSIDSADLTNIAVLPEYRRQGIAGALLQALLAETGEKEIFLEVRESNQNAIAFYQKYDFEQVGLRKNFYQNPTEHALVMKFGGKKKC